MLRMEVGVGTLLTKTLNASTVMQEQAVQVVMEAVQVDQPSFVPRLDKSLFYNVRAVPPLK